MEEAGTILNFRNADTWLNYDCAMCIRLIIKTGISFCILGQRFYFRPLCCSLRWMLELYFGTYKYSFKRRLCEYSKGKCKLVWLHVSVMKAVTQRTFFFPLISLCQGFKWHFSSDVKVYLCGTILSIKVFLYNPLYSSQQVWNTCVAMEQKWSFCANDSLMWSERTIDKGLIKLFSASCFRDQSQLVCIVLVSISTMMELIPYLRLVW
jgi:hypothetical protein